ncbi:MAG: cell division protein FtsZ [Candidatus Burarchaeum sp.]|nr:cell division protein FtsZ [Candidatus Burarchaeum sp.]MDO8340058.1 cell division protein FtsZ [Candidatus Burarchaeum sp.]
MDGFIESAIRNNTPMPEDMGATSSDKIRILVVGVGGGGCNTVHRLSNMGIKSAETIAVNTDSSHLKIVNANKRLLIGSTVTKGLGAGGYPEVAAKCAEISKDKLREAIGTCELVFLCAGMGGGTGTGASPIIAEIAKEQGAIVVSVVTYPFILERARLKKADWGLEELRKKSDTVIVIDNNRLAGFVPNLPINQAFQVADEITARAVKGIADTIMLPSLINIDFADVRSIMGGAGVAVISMGEGKGNNKVEDAAKSAIEHPLLDVDLTGAKGALIHIAGSPQLTLGEATTIGERITSKFAGDANVIWGARHDASIGDAVTVTAIMTGLTSKFQLGGKKEEDACAQLALDLEAML